MKQPLNMNNRPKFHFTAKSGWINDPNGLVFANGIYHMYFQFNPYGIEWGNMSWGHAVSKDLIHWKQVETVMYPDEYGMIFSGSGIINEKGKLGLPKDALIFFYTSAGKDFTQKIAYSLDQGNTLTKIEKPCLVNPYKDDRDPKVFWHEKSNSYIMVLWLEKTDFGIFRSSDLCSWEMSDRITLPDAWECPDFICMSDEEGSEKWVFLCADGYYFWGDFDGYHFNTDRVKHEMYFNKNLYAAQTYFGITDRTVFIPWLRLQNNGEKYTGAMGIPRELYVKTIQNERYLCQRPVKEWYDQLVLVEELSKENEEYQIDFLLKEECEEFSIIIEEVPFYYNRKNGILCIDKEKYQTVPKMKKISIIVDHNILEIFLEDGIQVGAYKIPQKKSKINRYLSLTNENNFSKIINASRM